MAVTIKCPDCGHTKQTDEGESETCPECEGTMFAPAKKKYQAKSSSLEEEERARKPKARDDEKPAKKKVARDEDEDEDEEEPKPRKKKARDEEEKGGGDYTCDGKAAERLGLDPGFDDRELLKQVADELARGEVLHYVCRPSRGIAKYQAIGAVFGGLIFSLIGVVVVIIMFTKMKDTPTAPALVPGIFVLFGLVIAVLGPIMKMRQARLGWYAVTDRRAIVFHIGLFGKGGRATTYQPNELRRMWVQKSWLIEGGGDIVFKTIITQHTTTTRDRRTGRTSTSTSTSKQHFGFIGIEDVKDVEALMHEILLGVGARDDDDDEDEDEPKPKKKPARNEDDEEDEPKPKKKAKRDDD
jgi:hypothetical protein